MSIYSKLINQCSNKISTDIDTSSTSQNNSSLTTNGILSSQNIGNGGVQTITSGIYNGISTAGNYFTTIDNSSYPYSYGSIYNNYNKIEKISDLVELNYNVFFEFDKKKLLSNSICEINDTTFIFKCALNGNRLQPYENIMQLINDEIKMSVKIVISDILTLCYTNFQFTNIENNFKFNNGYCNFDKLNVNFKFEKILYENNKLSEKEKRADKLKNILKNNE